MAGIIAAVNPPGKTAENCGKLAAGNVPSVQISRRWLKWSRVNSGRVSLPGRSKGMVLFPGLWGVHGDRRRSVLGMKNVGNDQL